MLDYNLLISDVRIIDGHGGPSFQGNVLVHGDRIAAIGELPSDCAESVIDGYGLVLAPGFIDVHTHDDLAILNTPDMTSKISQGVTTVVVGNCGISLSPFPQDREIVPPLTLIGRDKEFRYGAFAEYTNAIQKNPSATNVAALIGHTTLRAACMSSLDRPATKREIEKMAQQLAASLSNGAMGLSSGLDYPAAAQAPTAEVVSLCQTLREHGGIYTTHIRDERDQIAEALKEAFEIGLEAEVPMIISHKKCAGHKNWGQSKENHKSELAILHSR